MPERAYFEDFKVRDCIATPARTITQADSALFAAIAENWPGVDVGAPHASERSLGKQLSQWCMTLAIGSGLMFRAGERGIPRSTIALWGVENVRFVVPLKIGDTIHVENEVVQSTIIDAQRGLLICKYRVLNQHDEEVSGYTIKLLVTRRPAEVSGSGPPS
jgi:acyl dehydratase